MKARVSPTTAKMLLTDVQREAIRVQIERDYAIRQRVWVRRYLLATCLALNDLYQFGDKRLKFTLNALSDIIEDYSERAFDSRNEARHSDIDDPSEDPMSRLMEEELASRERIHIQIK